MLSPWLDQGYIRGVSFDTWFLTVPILLVSTFTTSPIYPDLNFMFENFSEGGNTRQCVTASLQILVHEKSKDSSVTDFCSDLTFSIPAWITLECDVFRRWDLVCKCTNMCVYYGRNLKVWNIEGENPKIWTLPISWLVLIFMCRITFDLLIFKSWHLAGTIPIGMWHDLYHRINCKGRGWKVEKVRFVFVSPAKWKMTMEVMTKFWKEAFPMPETCHIASPHAMDVC